MVNQKLFAMPLSGADQARTQTALLKTQALGNAILNSANFSIIATDEKGIIQLFNVGAERMLGYRADEVINRIKPSDIHDPQEVLARAQSLSLELGTSITPGFEALVYKASRGIEDSYELTYVCKDGSRFPALVSITALRDDYAALIGYLLIGADNSARKRVEAELINARAAAEKANLAKSDFLSNMSHELRSPLNAILGFAQLMASDSTPLTSDQKESTGHILQAGWYLLDLINEILDLALIESGKMQLSPEPTALDEVLLDCQTMIEPQAQSRGIAMTFHYFERPCYIHADRTRVKQVFINLLSNAIKYNRSGGTVRVDCDLQSAERVRVSVTDTGAGLSPDKLAQLFQPFNRLGQETSGEEGTGIGLVTTKRLVELMGGVIGVDSTVGAGSVFWVDWVRAAEPALVIDEGAVPDSSILPIIHDPLLRTLLYVEDNPANLRLVEQLVARRPGLRLLSADNAMHGMRLARAYLPEVILMDINLPGISGIRALRMLHEDPLTQHIPVVAISANAMPHDIRKGLEAGFFRYLTKPIKVDEFMTVLDVALDHAKAAAQGLKKPGNAVMLEASAILQARILIVDDQLANVRLLEQMLRADGYTQLSSTMQPTEVCALHRQHHYDLILLDLQMPGMDGFAVLEALKLIEPDSYVPVLVVTAQPAHKLRALQLGAKDFVAKPFDLTELKTRIHNMLEVRLLYRALDEHKRQLEQTVLERTAELRASEERFQRLTELSSDWYWEQDASGEFTQLSGPALERLGILADGTLDVSAEASGVRWNEPERRVLEANIAARRPFLDLVYSRIKADGSVQYFEVSGEPMFDAYGCYTGYRGIGADVSARLRAATDQV